MTLLVQHAAEGQACQPNLGRVLVKSAGIMTKSQPVPLAYPLMGRAERPSDARLIFGGDNTVVQELVNEDFSPRLLTTEKSNCYF